MEAICCKEVIASLIRHTLDFGSTLLSPFILERQAIMLNMHSVLFIQY